ncbi:hypothetical protein CEXT_159541 [Caerostris extrusa]|uniref:Uncharacterized protein n=1 Tax=Caerostris extrusa TaxID=172846 RepID=A0AAV4T1U4_CAEEX|nr:hypothetical protein CEXT_159541 [Caerostris extrusa]
MGHANTFSPRKFISTSHFKRQHQIQMNSFFPRAATKRSVFAEPSAFLFPKQTERRKRDDGSGEIPEPGNLFTGRSRTQLFKEGSSQEVALKNEVSLFVESLSKTHGRLEYLIRLGFLIWS